MIKVITGDQLAERKRIADMYRHTMDGDVAAVEWLHHCKLVQMYYNAPLLAGLGPAQCPHCGGYLEQ